MEYSGRTITLRDGRACLLRSPGPDDGKAMLDYLRRTAKETPYLIRYPDEIDVTLKEERPFLKQALEDPRRLMISAFVGGQVAGNAALAPVSPYRKFRHRAQLGVAVRKSCWGQGLGRALIEALCAAAPDMGYDQIELEVSSANRRAVELYERLGFEIWGERPRAFRYDSGATSSELLMVRRVEDDGWRPLVASMITETEE